MTQQNEYKLIVRDGCGHVAGCLFVGSPGEAMRRVELARRLAPRSTVELQRRPLGQWESMN
jgi:hypothetical protein